MEKAFTVFVGAILGLFLMAFISFLTAIPVMLLWDYVMPRMFGVPELGIFHAWALSYLCGLLFKGSSTVEAK